MTKTSPDSITDWIFNAFCLSKEYSFGIAPESTLKVFRPLFVSVNLPYSVVSNEIWPVQVSVFNYLNKCVPVSESLKIQQNHISHQLFQLRLKLTSNLAHLKKHAFVLMKKRFILF